MGRLCAALAIPIVLSDAAAEAQVSRSALVAPVEAGLSIVPIRSGLPDFRMPLGAFRAPPGQVRNGLIAALPLGRNVQVAVGRFIVAELPRPRTHMEADRRPADIRPRGRGIAAVGFSFRF